MTNNFYTQDQYIRRDEFSGQTLGAFTGAVTSNSPTAGVGYTTGAGGSVTQATSKSTGVTLNTLTGTITTNNAALAAGAEVSFTLTNSAIGANDVPVFVVKSGGTASSYSISITAESAGSCLVTISNLSAGSLSEALVLGFVIIKGATA